MPRTVRRSAKQRHSLLDPAQRRDLVQGIISRRTFAAGLGAAAITAPAFLRSSRALAAPAKVSFCLPWIPHGGYAFLFAAKKLGFWGNRALEVQVDRGFGSGETCKRVALGQYDYGLADFATMVKLADDGLPLACIGMVAHVSQLGILSLKESNIFHAQGSRGQDPRHHRWQRRLCAVASLRRGDRDRCGEGQNQHCRA